MKRRLTISILTTLWVILIAGGAVAFFTTRGILLEDLDHTLLMQAVVSAKAEFPEEFPNLPVASDARVYLLDSRRAALPERYAPPKILFASFTGTGLRTMTVEVNGPTSSRKIVASLPTQRYDAYVNTLLWSLGGFIMVTGIIVAAVARGIASAALKPLVSTAETIAAINERSLDQRIEAEKLPEELRPMARNLNEMLGRLDASFAARRQFLADASHELRTPVAALVTSLEVSLGRQRSLEQYQDVLRQALNDAHFLQQLSEGLIEAARAERDTASADEPLDVTLTLGSCCELLRPLADKKNVTLTQTIARRMVDSFDPRRLTSIVINLISNAIEYNRVNGTVTVEAKIELRSAIQSLTNMRAGATDSHALLIRVKDTGVGIAPKELARIFDPFYRVDDVRTQQTGESSQVDTPHMGLGLALVKRHVEAMGGQIGVSSNIGEGTTFEIMLAASMAAHVALPKPNLQVKSVHPPLITSRVLPV